MTTNDNKLAKVKLKNKLTGKRLSSSVRKLRKKLATHKESLRAIINAGDMLNLFEPDNVFETLSEYGDFGMVMGKDRTLLVYHQPPDIPKARCVASISDKTAILADYRGMMSAYSAVRIYDRLCDDIEGLVDITLRDILIRYERMDKEADNTDMASA